MIRGLSISLLISGWRDAAIVSAYIMADIRLMRPASAICRACYQATESMSCFYYEAVAGAMLMKRYQTCYQRNYR